MNHSCHLKCSLALVSPLILFGCKPAPQTPASPTTAKTGTVRLVVNFGDKKDSFLIENVADGTTLESLMRSVSEVPVKVKGSGTTAFVESIGDQATGASDGWTFKIDGAWSDRGVGQTELHPPTTITWSYGAWDVTHAAY